MPRPVSKKCVACVSLDIDEARIVHGKKAEKEADRCWSDQRCPRIRSYYRNRREINEDRRLEYAQKKAAGTGGDGERDNAIEIVSLPVAEETLPYANLYIWREKRKDAPIHAIAATVFQNGSKVLEVAPIHCAGYRRSQIQKYVHKDVMGYLKARFGITFFADEIRLEPIECPIAGCPWGDRFAASQEHLSDKSEVAHG